MKAFYPVQHWVYSLVLAPVLIQLYEFVTGNGFPDIGIMLLMLIIGLIYSMPVFLINYIVYIILTAKVRPAWIIKLGLDVVAIGGVIFIFHGVFKMQYNWFVPILYAVSIILTSLVLKIRETPKSSEWANR